MIKTSYHISKMDCPSEESLIRIKLEGISEIIDLQFDLDNRILNVFHSKENPEIEKRIRSLKLGCDIKSKSNENIKITTNDKYNKKLLWLVLGINLGFFFIESIFGLVSKSMGLVADSLDMLADAVVYGLSIWAVGSVISKKQKVAKISGYFQISLALLGFIEIIRRILFENITPNYLTMIWISAFALIGNATSMFILSKTNSKDANIMASKIFTSNDVIINLGVILAGFLVMITQSLIPDLVIGTLVFIIVVRGAIKILKIL